MVHLFFVLLLGATSTAVISLHILLASADPNNSTNELNQLGSRISLKRPEEKLFKQITAQFCTVPPVTYSNHYADVHK